MTTGVNDGGPLAPLPREALPASPPQPVEIRLKKSEKSLLIRFTDGASFTLPAEYLRVYSPSAEIQGHSPAERKLVAGRRQVGIINLEEVGHYALRIIFDDLHDTGLYTWDYLYELGVSQERWWKIYLAELAKSAKSRDPAPRHSS